MGQINSSIVQEALQKIYFSIPFLLPEIILVVGFLTVLISDLFLKSRKNKILTYISLAGFLSAFYFTGLQWQEFSETTDPLKITQIGFLGMIRVNTFAIFFKLLFLIAAVITVFFHNLSTDINKEKGVGEFFSVLFIMVIGLNLMVMADNLLMLYLSAEMISISAYVLSIFRFNKPAAEGSMKYFVFGSVSACFMLYGISLAYGISGSLEVTTLFKQVSVGNSIELSIVVLLILAGILFKISLFPFHIWVPDVYTSSPNPVTAFFSVAPKAAGLAVLIKIFHPFAVSLPYNYFALPLTIIAFVTLAIGNFSAIWQNNAKRLFAYSSIAHAGFLLSGFVALSETGVKSVMFYSSVYLLMNFAAFLLVDNLSGRVGSEDVRKFAGLGVKLPLTGVIFVIIVISLTGLPPTAGFYGKLLVFTSLWESYQSGGNKILLYLLLFGLFNAVISLFYYLKIPYIMYFKKAEQEITEKPNNWSNVLLSVLAFLIIWIFFQPNWLMKYLDKVNLNFLDISL